MKLYTMQPGRIDTGLASWHEARQIAKNQEWAQNVNYRRAAAFIALAIWPVLWLITKL